MNPDAKELFSIMAKELLNQCKIVEGGFSGYKTHIFPSGLPPFQEEELRNAFFAGAQHLYGTMMAVFSEAGDPSDEDMRNMDAIHTELKEFIKSFKVKHFADSRGGRA